MKAYFVSVKPPRGAQAIGNYVINWASAHYHDIGMAYPIYIKHTLESQNLTEIVVVDLPDDQTLEPQVISKTIEFTPSNRSVFLLRAKHTRLLIGIKMIKPALIEDNNTFPDNLQQLLMDDIEKDVTLKVGTEEFQAHKLILAARSPIFKYLFGNHISENSFELALTDVSPEAFRIFLQFIYTNKLEKPGNWAEEVLFLGDKYGVEELKVGVANYLMETITVKNAIETLLIFEKYQIIQLQREAIRFIAENRETAYNTQKKDLLQNIRPILDELIGLAIHLLN